MTVLTPRLAIAKPDDVAAAIRALTGDRKLGEGRIRLDVPAVAENGLAVPIAVDVDSPMTDTDFVRAVHVFADGNPLPNVVSFTFTPLSGKASAATRMRLAATQTISAIAEMSDGRVFAVRQDIKVIVGGCAT